MIRVLVVHEHHLICNVIMTVLQDKPGLEVIGYATAIGPALTYLEKQPCDILVASSKLPNGAALHLAHFVYSRAHATKILVTDMPRSDTFILHYLEEGVKGYVYEHESVASLTEKIYALHQDEFALHPSIAANLMRRIGELKRQAAVKSAILLSDRSHLLRSLSQREHEVFQLLTLGLTNEEIANTLVIGVGTAKNHVHNVFIKLAIHKREDVVLFQQHLSGEQQLHSPS